MNAILLVLFIAASVSLSATSFNCSLFIFEPALEFFPDRSRPNDCHIIENVVQFKLLSFGDLVMINEKGEISLIFTDGVFFVPKFFLDSVKGGHIQATYKAFQSKRFVRYYLDNNDISGNRIKDHFVLRSCPFLEEILEERKLVILDTEKNELVVKLDDHFFKYMIFSQSKISSLYDSTFVFGEESYRENLGLFSFYFKKINPVNVKDSRSYFTPFIQKLLSKHEVSRIFNDIVENQGYFLSSYGDSFYLSPQVLKKALKFSEVNDQDIENFKKFPEQTEIFFLNLESITSSNADTYLTESIKRVWEISTSKHVFLRKLDDSDFAAINQTDVLNLEHEKSLENVKFIPKKTLQNIRNQKVDQEDVMIMRNDFIRAFFFYNFIFKDGKQHYLLITKEFLDILKFEKDGFLKNFLPKDYVLMDSNGQIDWRDVHDWNYVVFVSSELYHLLHFKRSTVAMYYLCSKSYTALGFYFKNMMKTLHKEENLTLNLDFRIMSIPDSREFLMPLSKMYQFVSYTGILSFDSPNVWLKSVAFRKDIIESIQQNKITQTILMLFNFYDFLVGFYLSTRINSDYGYLREFVPIKVVYGIYKGVRDRSFDAFFMSKNLTLIDDLNPVDSQYITNWNDVFFVNPGFSKEFDITEPVEFTLRQIELLGALRFARIKLFLSFQVQSRKGNFLSLNHCSNDLFLEISECIVNVYFLNVVKLDYLEQNLEEVVHKKPGLFRNRIDRNYLQSKLKQSSNIYVLMNCEGDFQERFLRFNGLCQWERNIKLLRFDVNNLLSFFISLPRISQHYVKLLLLEASKNDALSLQFEQSSDEDATIFIKNLLLRFLIEGCITHYGTRNHDWISCLEHKLNTTEIKIRDKKHCWVINDKFQCSFNKLTTSDI